MTSTDTDPTPIGYDSNWPGNRPGERQPMTTNRPPTGDTPAPVFVYGSLLPGEGNARLWEQYGDRYRAVAAIVDGLGLRYSHTAFPYGFLVPDEMTVGAVLVGVDVHLLARLDHLEGHPRHYRRTPVLVETEEGPMHAWVYVAGDHRAARVDGMRPVPDNDWVAFLNDRYAASEVDPW